MKNNVMQKKLIEDVKGNCKNPDRKLYYLLDDKDNRIIQMAVDIQNFENADFSNNDVKEKFVAYNYAIQYLQEMQENPADMKKEFDKYFIGGFYSMLIDLDKISTKENWYKNRRNDWDDLKDFIARMWGNHMQLYADEKHFRDVTIEDLENEDFDETHWEELGKLKETENYEFN